jgi:hypothetical protein
MNRTLWMDDNGRIICGRHAGSYLSSAIDARPRASSHRTPLGTWDRLDAMFREEWESIMGSAPECESCK